jgi:hypothetical protein
MNLKLNDMEFKDIIQLLGGFVTKENEDLLKFNLIASPDLTFNTAMQLLQSMTMQILFAFKQQKPEALNDIYDAYNFMASSVLEQLIPDREIRMDLDEEAILELEVKKIEERFEELTAEQKEEALAKIEAIKARLKNGNKED